MLTVTKAETIEEVIQKGTASCIRMFDCGGHYVSKSRLIINSNDRILADISILSASYFIT